MLISQLVTVEFDLMLQSLAGQLSKADTHMQGLELAFEDLLQERLAEDMFPLASQIRFTCQQAMEAPCRLLGDPLPEAPPVASLADAAAAIALARQSVGNADPARLDNAFNQPLELHLPNGIRFALSGADYVLQWAVPQFHFHLIAAYAIMRKAGVPLGKADYVPHMMQHLQA